MESVRHPIRWLRGHPLHADVALFLGVTAIAVGFAATSPLDDGQRALGGLGWTLLVAMHVPVIWRRISPVSALWVSVAITVAYWIFDYNDGPAGTNLLILLYSLAAHEPRPRAVRHFLGSSAVLIAVLFMGAISDSTDLPWFLVPANIVIIATSWVLGDNLRTRRDYLLELEAKAALAETQKIAESDRAVREERTRIARELHDVVAHSMSVMVVQAGAARRVVASNPADAERAIAAIEETGRESLNEMRRVVGVLREAGETADLAPAPGIDDVGRLIDHCEDAGLHVDLEIEGEARSLTPGLELSAYRIVQESLTNTLKHAGPAQARVHLRYGPDSLRLEVTDDGRGAAATSQDGGQGLIGMRERVDAFNGSLSVGPSPGGGFRVVAELPVEPIS